METSDTSLGAIKDVEEILGTQVLGVIPQADAKDILEDLKDKYPEESKEPSLAQIVYLVSHFALLSMIAESFRALRTNIQFKDTERKIKTIAIPSTSPQEGKTLVAANLAITMAQAEMKILLVGADLRMPQLAKVFGVEKTPGLTDILLGNYPWCETVKTITDIIMGRLSLDQIMMTSGLDNLHIITSGAIPPNPAELIDSGRLMDFMEEAKEKYDIILLDSTPILSAADSMILGKKVDGVLLVYRLGAVSRGLLKRSTTQLNQVNCHVMGVVLNGMRPEVSPDFHDYKYYKYYSYGNEGRDRRGLETKKGFLSIGRKGDGSEGENKEVFLSKGERVARGGGKQHNILRLSILVIALISLAVGILWQNGILDPFEMLTLEKAEKGNEIQRPIKKKVPTAAIQKKAKALTTRPKTRISQEKPVLKAETHSPFSPPVAKEGTDIETVASSEKELSYPYSLYLGSFRTLKRAKRAISMYSREDLSPYWVKVKLSKGIWYRVYAGYFEERREADGLKEKHGLTEATIKKTKYANLIGTYTSSEELERQILSLKKLRNSPYFIKDHNGKSRLFVGAFLTRAGADRQYHELKSSGIESEVIKR